MSPRNDPFFEEDQLQLELNRFLPGTLDDVPLRFHQRAQHSQMHREFGCIELSYEDLEVNHWVGDKRAKPSTYHGVLGKVISWEGKVKRRCMIYEQIFVTCGNSHCINQQHLKSKIPNEFHGWRDGDKYGSIMDIPF